MQVHSLDELYGVLGEIHVVSYKQEVPACVCFYTENCMMLGWMNHGINIHLIDRMYICTVISLLKTDCSHLK